MGIVPGFGGATHLVQKVGPQAALDLLLTSRLFDAQSALDIGLITDILPSTNENQSSSDMTEADDWALQHAMKLLESKIGHLPAQVVHGLKSVVIGTCHLDYDESIRHERGHFKNLWGGEANKAALFGDIRHK